MWPKAIAQLIELLPHAARLLPMADKFLQARNGSDEATQRAMNAMTDGLRGDLGQVTAAHAGLYRQLDEQNEKLTGIAAEALAAHAAAQAANQRIAALEQQLKRVLILLAVLVVFALITLAFVLRMVAVYKPH